MVVDVGADVPFGVRRRDGPFVRAGKAKDEP
jgi:hypothetical protein